jgi:hypothetical protein
MKKLLFAAVILFVSVFAMSSCATDEYQEIEIEKPTLSATDPHEPKPGCDDPNGCDDEEEEGSAKKIN